jgi:hypothetical protein
VNFTFLHHDMGHYDLAMSLHTEAMAASRRINGDEDTQTLVTISNIMALYSDKGACWEPAGPRQHVPDDADFHQQYG